MIGKKGARKFPLSSLFPNIVTIIGLCFGMTSIKFALEGRWELAVGLLVISAFIDGMDGRLARMLNASSRFGAELDSLTDFVNFGVAPAFILYSWSLHNLSVKGAGWAIALIYTICCGLRLARFNASINHKDDNFENNFFLGVPAPCGAGLTLIPIMMSFQYGIDLFQEMPLYLAYYLLTVAFLMASQIPTLSLKNVKISNYMIFPTLIFFTILTVAMVSEPWVVLPIMGVVYVASIPIAVVLSFTRKIRSNNNDQ